MQQIVSCFNIVQPHVLFHKEGVRKLKLMNVKDQIVHLPLCRM